MQERLIALQHLAGKIDEKDEWLDAHIHRTYHHNLWFPKENYWDALEAIKQKMLNSDSILEWINHYSFPVADVHKKRVGIVFAGNIPLVGFHDFLAIYLSGHETVIKLSSKDPFVFPAIIKIMGEKDPSIHSRVKIVERLEIFDAVIATGSNNSNRYFEYYFSEVPNILRKNRTSVSILKGDETPEELLSLGKDIFSYYGLGCRNVTKIFVPSGYGLQDLLDQFSAFDWVIQNSKYKNNFDYNLSIELLNRSDHFSNNFLVLKRDNSALSSPIGMLYFDDYSNIHDVEGFIQNRKDQIQCVVGNHKVEDIPLIPFGKSQEPGLFDYPDGVDVGHFLVNIA
ncbi:acyl-CoA reductase [Membranihabitans maritimus]|uniref:acyl-CoA reductase n=1 Tax=Membranihabitans maritimus TaxID=2904244 RepID=UPI001F35088A|nr:acyl-CoA reductase [Membranihabitans maritimus]